LALPLKTTKFKKTLRTWFNGERTIRATVVVTFALK